MVATAMFFEHLRRCRLLGIGKLLTATWLFYRVVLLTVIVLTKPY